MDPIRECVTAAGSILRQILRDRDVDIEPVFDPAPEGMGDIAFPCHRLARTLRKSPAVIAEELAVTFRDRIGGTGDQGEGGRGPGGGRDGGRDADPGKLIASVEAVNGFLNITFSTGPLVARTLSALGTEGTEYGRGSPRGESIILEHTSANPNGPFHVGRARNPIIGDTLGRILAFAGYHVTTEYYVNDMGKQAILLAWGVENLADTGTGGVAEEDERGGREGEDDCRGREGEDDCRGREGEEPDDAGSLEWEPGVGKPPDDGPKEGEARARAREPAGHWSRYREKPDHRFVEYYQQASALMESDPVIRDRIDGLLARYESGDPIVGGMVGKYCREVLGGMRATLGKINVSMDSFVFESTFVYRGDVTRVIEALNRSRHSHAEDTARYLELEGFGIHGRDTRFFYTRKGGTSLYTTRDLAYHLDKFSRADRVINVLGEDHRLQARQLAIALGELGETRVPESIFYAFVSLPEGKMSTRRGRVIYLDQLMEEALERAFGEVTSRRPDLAEAERRRIAEYVGIGAIRFNILRVQMEKAITFKWEEALSFDGDSAPFIQYTHARACSILRRAGWRSGAGEDGPAEGDPMEGGPAEGDPMERDPVEDPGMERNSVPGGSIVEGRDAGTQGYPEHGSEDAPSGHRYGSGPDLTDPNEIALVRMLARFPGVIHQCASDLKIHPLAGYLRDLAQEFNQFYRECPVLTADSLPARRRRLILVDGFRTVVAQGLGLLGIAAPEYM